jgi:hypothetical protein
MPIACVLVVGISIVFLRSEFNETANQPASPLIAGWDDLISCSYTVSFDGAKQLELFEDHRVTLSAVGDDKIDKIAEGEWSFYENAKRYTIAVDGSPPPSIPGWGDLIRCSYMVSFDGTCARSTLASERQDSTDRKILENSCGSVSQGPGQGRCLLANCTLSIA